MKLQLEGQHLRVRIDEDELAQLLAGRPVTAHTQLACAFALGCTLALSSESIPAIEGHAEAWSLRLPRLDVQALATRLPTRDGLHYTLPAGEGNAPLDLLFDVDVRDSARRLKATRHP